MPSRRPRPFAGAEPIRIPKLRLHKPSGRAVVTLNGVDIYCGPWGSREAKAEYDRVTAAWLANGRLLPTDNEDLRLSELGERYMQHAVAYYRHADGKPTGELHPIRCAVVALGERFGRERVAAFGPSMLREYQAFLVSKDWARTTINRAVGRVRRMVKWATSREIIPPSILHALQSVEPLKRGRTTARESTPIKPVAMATVEATLPFLPAPVQAMVKVQAATGMRPGEVCIMRTVDVDRSVNPWRYVPAVHKTQVHGKSRVVFLGPKAQEALQPFLRDDEPTAYLFRPSESMQELRDKRAATRKTPLHYGNGPGTNRKANPKRVPADKYGSTAYARCIARACAENKVPHWHPNQLRHAAATRIRAAFGIEAASTILGHSNLETTQIYAESNQQRAAEIASQIG
jgi:integrase